MSGRLTCRLIVLALLIVTGPTVCRSALAQAAPVRVFGFLGYERRFDRFDDAEDRVEQSTLFSLNGASAVWEPWFAQLSGGVNLRLRESSPEEYERTGAFVGGRALLHLFPVSRFPFEMHYERRHDDVDADLFDSATDSTRYGILQRYSAPGGAVLQLRLEHQRREHELTSPERRSVDEIDIAQVSVGRNFETGSLHFDSRWQELDESDTGEERTGWFNALRHRYRPISTLTVNGQLSFYEFDIEHSGANRMLERFEWSEFALWRPRTEKPLVVTGAARYVDSATGVDSIDLERQSFASSVGTRYQLTANWGVGADLNARTSKVAGDASSSSLQRAIVSYTSDVIDLGNVDYNWYGSLEAGNETNDRDVREDIRYAELRLAHEAVRLLFANLDSPVRLRLHQGASAFEGSDERTVQTLDHGLFLSWSRIRAASSTFLGFTLSDSRTFGGGGPFGDESSEQQLASLQLSRSQTVSLDSGLSGSLYLQAYRRTGFIDVDEDGDADGGKVEPSANVDLTYRHQRLFGVNRLRFRSTLRYFSSSYQTLLDESVEETEYRGRAWENRLQYSIGRLGLLLTTRLSEVRGRDTGLVLFQIRRNFDSIY